MAELSRRPYLLRAMVEWMIDSGHTPHAIVDANIEGVEVPRAFVNEGRIVLNISPSATQGLSITSGHMEFNARFSGTVHHVHVPVNAVLGVYARETGEGMVFPEETGEPSTDPTPTPPASPDPPPKRSHLKVVK